MKTMKVRLTKSDADAGDRFKTAARIVVGTMTFPSGVTEKALVNLLVRKVKARLKASKVSRKVDLVRALGESKTACPKCKGKGRVVRWPGMLGTVHDMCSRCGWNNRKEVAV